MHHIAGDMRFSEMNVKHGQMGKRYVSFNENYHRQNTKSTTTIFYLKKPGSITFGELLMILSRCSLSEKRSLFHANWATGHSLKRRVLLHFRDAVAVFDSPSWQGGTKKSKLNSYMKFKPIYNYTWREPSFLVIHWLILMACQLVFFAATQSPVKYE